MPDQAWAARHRAANSTKRQLHLHDANRQTRRVTRPKSPWRPRLVQMSPSWRSSSTDQLVPRCSGFDRFKAAARPGVVLVTRGRGRRGPRRAQFRSAPTSERVQRRPSASLTGRVHAARGLFETRGPARPIGAPARGRAFSSIATAARRNPSSSLRRSARSRARGAPAVALGFAPPSIAEPACPLVARCRLGFGSGRPFAK